MITTYSLAKHGNERVSENFRVYEFRCRDGSDEIRISSETVGILQAVRDYFGRPVTINSAYRTAEYNASPAVNGAKNSQHVKGTACDIKVKGVPPAAIAAFLEARYPKHGIGLYSSFVHIDSRGYKSYWRDAGSKVVTTFGLGSIYEKYKATEENREEELELTIPEIKKALLADRDFCRQCAEVYINEQKSKPVSDWAQQEGVVEWAKSNGISDGTAPQGFLTREQAMAMLSRLFKILGK